MLCTDWIKINSRRMHGWSKGPSLSIDQFECSLVVILRHKISKVITKCFVYFVVFCCFLYFIFISFILIWIYNSSAWQSNLRQVYTWNGIKHSLRNIMKLRNIIEEPSKCQSIHESFRIWLVHLSYIKFLIGYYLMSISYHNVMSGYQNAEYDIITNNSNKTM